MTAHTRSPRVRALTAAIAFALPFAALAETATEAQADDARDGSQGDAQLEAVTVTAERRVENIQKVPIAITTLSDEKLDVIGSGGEDIRFLSGRLPSLNIESSFGRAFPRFYIRGLGNTDFDLNASQPVSLVYDEVVQENPILKGFPVFDLDQIEMLRGPQGTLFGRNTPAGVLKFESRKPQQERDGYAQVSYGTYDSINFEGAVGGGLSEVLSARISGMYQRRDDYVDNTFTGENDALEGYRESAVRAQFLLEPSENFNALFNAHARNLDGTARLFRANIIKPGTNELVDGFDRDEVSIDGRNFQELDQFGASARLSWSFDRVNLYSITGYESVDTLSRGDIDGGFGAVFAPPSGPGLIPFPSESADGLPDHRQITQEFRLESDEWGQFDWQAGLFYFDEDITIDSFSYDTLAGGVENGYAVQDQRNKAWAAYLSGEYAFTDSFTLKGGLRYTDDEKEFKASRITSPIGAGPIGPLRANPSDNDVSGDLSAVWQASDDVNFFARVAKGFRAPSIQGRLLFGDTLSQAESETVLSVEGGLKADLWDNRARLGVTLFSYRVDDLQLTAVGGTANFNQLINADRATGQGIEVDFDTYLTDRLLVSFGGSYNDTEIEDDTLAVAPCGGGCTVTDPAGPVAGTVLIDGNPLPQAPKWVGNVTARYSIPLGEGELFFFTDWAYRGSTNFFLYESKEFRGKPLLEGGLRIGYNWDQYEVAVFGRNITNEEQVVGGIDFNNLTGFLNEPRIYGVELTARF